tara:strand:- start:2914 stop:3783 length:870 start_codon:yes stop_codon:yes gene_type:complete
MEIKEEINLEDIFNKIKINLRIVIALPLAVTLLTAIYSLSIPNTFKATVKYSVEDQFFSSSNTNSISSLLSISQSGPSIISVVEEVLYSREFLSYIINDEYYKELIFAGRGKDDGNELYLDSNLIDLETRKWIEVPELRDIHEKFTRSISFENSKDGIGELSYIHESRKGAVEIVNKTFSSLNKFMSSRAKQSSQENINFLNDILKSVSEKNVQNSIAELIKIETKELMLASKQQNYIFSSIQAAYEPYSRYQPKRSLICLIAFFSTLSLVFFILIISQIFGIKLKYIK